jgi:hypothetical protein
VLSQSPVYLPPPPALHEGQENRFRTKIVVSHLNSPGDFYVRIDENEKIYANMTRQLDLHFAKSSLLLEQLKPAEVKTVGLACATNADGQWNRCLIVDIVDDKTVTVRLTDVGKMIKASCTQLFRLDSSRELISFLFSLLRIFRYIFLNSFQQDGWKLRDWLWNAVCGAFGRLVT